MAKCSIVEVATIWYTYSNSILGGIVIKDIIKKIEQVDEMQLQEIIDAVMHRYSALRTDRELAFLSLPKDLQTRAEELEGVLQLIRTCYEKPPQKP